MTINKRGEFLNGCTLLEKGISVNICLSRLGVVKAQINLLEVGVQCARCIMSLLIQSAEGVLRKDRGSGEGGGGGLKKKSQLKLKNATK